METVSISRRKPLISIIITSENDSEYLKKCIDSFIVLKNDIKNIEFIVINNYSSNNEKMESIKFLINRYNEANLIFYQSNHKLLKSQARNLGIDFSKGTWLYFIDHTDIATPKFISFLGKFKFDIQKDFYRFPILDHRKKKIKMGLFNSKYFSTNPSTFIISEEFLEKTSLRWEPNIRCGETILFLNEIYSVRNVNYIYLKKHYSIHHNFEREAKSRNSNNFDEVIKTYNHLLENKIGNYKQFIIILFYNFLSIQRKEKSKDKDLFDAIKQMNKQAKINFFSYLCLGPKMFWKTVFIWFKTLF